MTHMQTRGAIAFSAAAVGLLLVAGAALAQGTPTNAAPTSAAKTVPAAREEAMQKKTGIKEETKGKGSAMKEKMAAAKKERVQKVVDVLEVRVQKFEEFVARIEAHLAKFSSKGVETSASQALVETAKSKIAETKTAIDALKAQFESALTNTNQRTALKAVVGAARDAEAKLGVARAALVDAINSLKPGQNKTGASPTTEQATPTAR